MKKLIILIVLLLFAAGGLFVWYQNGLTPVNAQDHSEQIFTIQPGTGVKAIAEKLQKEGLIKDATIFYLYAKQEKLGKKIQAGDFRLSPSMSAKQVAQNLTKGTLDIWVTIPEGKRAEEIAAILKEKIPTYDPSWDSKLEQNEGYLFPDTYLIPRQATADQVTSLLRSTFDQRFHDINLSQTSLSQSEIVTVASLVEREARHDEDRPLIASVIYNRLEEGMPLQIDATVQYALGYNTREKTWWTKNLSLDDLKISSAYNTYTHQGLPPGPICNPGVAALQAAAHPAKTNYTFYVTDKNGINHYASTYKEHLANIKQYGL